MGQHPDIDDKLAAAAALTAMTEHGVPHDVQELLVIGNPTICVPPGALSKAMKAALRAYIKQVHDR